MVKRLLDKVVVITGATSGIGLEIARLSISQGANVIISGRREKEGEMREQGVYMPPAIIKHHHCATINLPAGLDRSHAIHTHTHCFTSATKSTFDLQSGPSFV